MNIEPGDIVEIVHPVSYEKRLREGDRFTVDAVDPGFEPGDPEYGDPEYLQGPIVYGWARHGDAEVQASDLRLVTKAADVDRPTPDRVAAALRMDYMSDEPWFCHAESNEGDGIKVFEFVDEETGTEYVAEVRVTHLEEMDL